MKKYFIMGLLMAGSLSAEQIGNVTYRLPSENWGILDQMNNEAGSTHIYVPLSSNNESHQFFSAHSNNIPSPSNVNEGSIQKSLQKMFPGEDIQVQILNRDGQSVLYKWDTQYVHGITRIFPSQNGTTLLSYHSENPDYLQGKFLNHIQSTLLDAKITR